MARTGGRRGGQGRRILPTHVVRRLAVLIPLAALMGWAVVAVGMGAYLETRRPALALRFQQNNPVAAAALAFEQLSVAGGPSAEAKARAARLATAALAESPVVASAPRTLAIVAAAAGQERRSVALMDYALRLSRRDLPVHLWFIERGVARDDIPRVLDHYDMALRTSSRGRAVLIPVLVQATEDPAIRSRLIPLLAERPRWGDEYLAALARSSEVAPAAAQLARALERRGLPIDPYREAQIANQLIARQEFAAARELLEGKRTGPLLRDGAFREASNASPFAWQLTSSYDFGADRAGGNGEAGSGLSIFASRDRGGEVARQLLTLAPGSYRLTTTASGVAAEPGDRPYWMLACARPNTPEIGRLDLAPGRRARAEGRFQVPAGCGGQYLILVTRPPVAAEGIKADVHDVAIQRL